MVKLYHSIPNNKQFICKKDELWRQEKLKIPLVAMRGPNNRLTQRYHKISQEKE